jgi:hypothetical protein
MAGRQRSVLFFQHRQLEWSLNVSLVVAEVNTETEPIGLGQCADLPTKLWIIGYATENFAAPGNTFGFHSAFLNVVPVVYLIYMTADGVILKNAPSESKFTHPYSHCTRLANSSLCHSICSFTWK